MIRIHSILPALAAISLTLPVSAEESMDKMWGDRRAKEGVEGSKRAELFRDGNYGMFIHWGLYSHLGGQWKDKTFYGIGEWVMNGNMAGIPVEEYMGISKEFNPSEFDANEVVRIAKEAGMKWIIITSKHHEGYKGEGRPVWSVTTSEGVKIQNQQAASHIYKPYRTGIIGFSKPGNTKSASPSSRAIRPSRAWNPSPSLRSARSRADFRKIPPIKPYPTALTIHTACHLTKQP